MKIYSFVAVFAVVIFTMRAHAQAAVPDPTVQRQQYDAIYSQYIDFCGLTQYKEIGQEWGGIYGHSVMYIKGACQDETRTDFPHIRKCNDNDGPNAGVGISLDSFFTNVAWIAVNGRDFVFYGDLPPDQPLNNETREAIYTKAIAKNIAPGVILEDWIEKEWNPKNETRAHFLARKTFGTEFGVSLARSAYCARIPIVAGLGKPKDAILNDVIGYLNGLNDKMHAKTGGIYDPGSFNCTTLIHNTLAAIGFWGPLDTNWSSYKNYDSVKDYIDVAKHYNDLAIPLNEAWDALIRGSGDESSLHLGSLLSRPELRAPLMNYGWLPAEPGVVIDFLPIHSYENKLFVTTGQPILFTVLDELMQKMKMKPIWYKTNEFKSYVEQKSITDLRENLLLWKKRYMEIARRMRRFHPDDPAYPVYKQYLIEQMASVNNGLSIIGELAN